MRNRYARVSELVVSLTSGSGGFGLWNTWDPMIYRLLESKSVEVDCCVIPAWRNGTFIPVVPGSSLGRPTNFVFSLRLTE